MEQLLQEASGWSEHDAEIALRAVDESTLAATRMSWGDLSKFHEAAFGETMQTLAEEERAAWHVHAGLHAVDGNSPSLIQLAPSGGERTAALIPGARLQLTEDMDHNRPEPLWPQICGTILEHTG
ncbi:MAG TPA: hypothetical protein VK272_01730 [Solirubrobacteraceae bacterium]|nr:hypothetical protein [Solirubrobacteraceae bacterium]